MADHEKRIAAEIEVYRNVGNIHDLPDIYFYWANKFLAPHIADVFGDPNVQSVLAKGLVESLRETGNPSIVSIGAGDGSVEIGLSGLMRDLGEDRFRFECLELSPYLIERGRAAVTSAGLDAQIRFVECDINTYLFEQDYGAAFAHHSLHHITNLEHVFDQVRSRLVERGAFVISDMIGRNGHMRWPEVLAPLVHIWHSMPPRYKFHHRLGRRIEASDPDFNWDCSGEGFEGIRAQDIMPCLIECFDFEKMCVWGGLLDHFIDRGYGPNFSPENSDDTALIDRICAADFGLLNARATTPTQMVAILKGKGLSRELRSSFGLTPQECVNRLERS